jgi:hypothetical protein
MNAPIGTARAGYLTFALAFLRSAQYFVIRSDTTLRAAADIRRPLFCAFCTDWRSARRRWGSASSGNVRSMATISARSWFRTDSAPARASSRTRPVLSPLALATCPPRRKEGIYHNAGSDMANTQCVLEGRNDTNRSGISACNPAVNMRPTHSLPHAQSAFDREAGNRTPIRGASLYVYQTDREGYYGVKPARDSRNPRLKLFLRSDARGAHSLRGVGAWPPAEDLRDRLRR